MRRPTLRRPTWKRPSRRVALLSVGGVVVVLGLTYVTGWALTGATMPHNTTIAQVNVGGKSPDAAEKALTEGIADRLDEPIMVAHSGATFDLVPSEVSLEVDIAESVAEAGGRRSWAPSAIWALVVGGDDHPPVLDVETAVLAAAIDAIGDEVDVPVVEPMITFPKGEPKPRAPEAGEVIKRSELRQDVQDAYLMTSDPVEAPMDQVSPSVDAAGLDRAMREIAEPAVSGPIELRVGDTSVDLPVTAWTPALTVEAIKGEMKPLLDAEKLAEPLTSATTGLGSEATDASFKFVGGKVEIVPGKAGVGLDPQRMSLTLIPALTKTGDERFITVETTAVQPSFTTDDARKLGIKERMGSFTTKYPYAEYRNINQGQAAKNLNGTVLKPGETFSFNKTVGERTVANGFVSGIVINGGVFREELGGGVSQTVTTAYNAGFFAGLEDVEHHPHAFYIDRYPIGREATVYYGNLDLRFKNPYKTGVLIRAWIDPSAPGRDGAMHVEMWGTKVYTVEAGKSAKRNFRQPGVRYDDTGRCVPQGAIQGFDIDIYRVFKQSGKVVRKETNTAYYQAADRVVCGKKPKKKDDKDDKDD